MDYTALSIWCKIFQSSRYRVGDGSEQDGSNQPQDELAMLLTDAGAHDDAIAYHMAQLEKMLSALSESRAVLYCDRVLQNGSRYESAEVVLVHRGKLYVADFKAWKGEMEYPSIFEVKKSVEIGWFWDSVKEERVETGRRDSRKVLQTKESQRGYWHQKEHRNPVMSVTGFSKHLKRTLAAGDSRWKSATVRALAVFPDGDAKLSTEMHDSGDFMYFSEFLALLADNAGRATPQWMLDGLARVPTWDLVQDAAGHLHQGILTTQSFKIETANGVAEIAFSNVVKIETVMAGTDEACTKVLLFDSQGIQGTLLPAPITLTRRGHARTLLLSDMPLICPAFQLLNSHGVE